MVEINVQRSGKVGSGYTAFVDCMSGFNSLKSVGVVVVGGNVADAF